MRKGAPTKVLFLRDFCTRSHGSSCKKCVEACPKSAIAFGNNNAAIDSHACTSCGICMGVCDAFSLPTCNLEGLLAKARQIALADYQVILTCTYVLPSGFEPADNVIALPCIACLPTELFSALLAQGIDISVAVSFDACEECTRTKGSGLDIFSAAIEQAEADTEMSVSFSDDVPERHLEGGVLQTLSDASHMERRDAFDTIKDQVEDIASGTYRMRRNEQLRQMKEQTTQMQTASRIGTSVGSPETNGFVPGGVARRVLMPRQRMVLEAADASDCYAVTKMVVISSTDSNKCTQDRNCVAVCPSGARMPDSIWGELTFCARLCIGCGLCVRACTQDAIALREVAAGELLDESALA